MHSSLLFVSAIVALASAQVTPGSIFLGERCNPNDANSCSYGAQCYATNSMLIPACGNFQAACTNNAQCAFNTCNAGLCNGPPANASIAIGQPCSPKLPGQCVNGAQCYGVTYMTIPTCGSFQSSCTSSSQCATNLCNGGFCNGLLRNTTVTNPQPPATPTPGGGGIVYHNTTSILPQTTGYTTSVVVVGGSTTNVLVNAAGSTTAIGGGGVGNPTSPPSTTATLQSTGSSKAVHGLGALFAVAVGFAMML